MTDTPAHTGTGGSAPPPCAEGALNARIVSATASVYATDDAKMLLLGDCVAGDDAHSCDRPIAFTTRRHFTARST